MKYAKRMLMVAGAVALAGIVGVAIAPKAAHGIVAAMVQIVPGSTTHVGTTESNLVSLLCNPGFSGGGVGGACQSVDAAGAVSGSESGYVVPTGSTLIITDYEWQQTANVSSTGCCGGPNVPGTYLCDYFLEFKESGFLPIGITLLPQQSCALADKAGLAYGREHFTTGIRVASGIGIFDNLAALSLGTAGLQGYLVPN